jgi:hypothetical protein
MAKVVEICKLADFIVEVRPGIVGLPPTENRDDRHNDRDVMLTTPEAQVSEMGLDRGAVDAVNRAVVIVAFRLAADRTHGFSRGSLQVTSDSQTRLLGEVTGQASILNIGVVEHITEYNQVGIPVHHLRLHETDFLRQ